MSRECPAGQWPFATTDRRLTGASYDPDAQSAAVAFVGVAAEALDSDPLALPTLNERIDPDYVDALLAGVSTNPSTGVRVAVEASFGEVSVLLRDDGCIEAYPAGREPNELEPSPAVEHDWSSADSLLWSVGRAIATVSDEDSTTVTTRLIEQVDTDATDRLLRPLATGSERHDSRLLLSVDGYEVAVDPDGSITVEPSLAVLKRSGAALLVVGSVPEQGFDRASATLLGDPGEARSPVFALHGRDLETARRRLSMASIPPAEGTVIEHRTHARAASPAATEDNGSSDPGPAVVPVLDGIRALPQAVRETVGDTPAGSPGELRLCVDSLGSMIEATDLETTCDVVEPICRLVRERRGIGSFLLPVDADGEAVEALAPAFDAVVALRMGDVGVEQRWRLTGTGHETPWFPVE